MWDDDYEEFLQDQKDAELGRKAREGGWLKLATTEPVEVNVGGGAVKMGAGTVYTKAITKDSGEKSKYDDGMVRDSSAGKPQFSLMFPKGIPYEEQLITRVADLYHRGAVKYGDRNWEKSNSEESLAHHEDALMRHVIKFLLGVEDGEDHAAAVVWNVNAVDLTRKKIDAKEQEEAAARFKKVAEAPVPDDWREKVLRRAEEHPETVVYLDRKVREVHPKYESEEVMAAVDEMGKRDAENEQKAYSPSTCQGSRYCNCGKERDDA